MAVSELGGWEEGRKKIGSPISNTLFLSSSTVFVFFLHDERLCALSQATSMLTPYSLCLFFLIPFKHDDAVPVRHLVLNCLSLERGYGDRQQWKGLRQRRRITRTIPPLSMRFVDRRRFTLTAPSSYLSPFLVFFFFFRCSPMIG